MTAGEIAAQMKADVGDTDMEAYYAEVDEPETPDPEDPEDPEDPDDEEPDGISVVKADNVNVPTYNITGQKVSNGFKGLVVKEGKKFMNK